MEQSKILAIILTVLLISLSYLYGRIRKSAENDTYRALTTSALVIVGLSLYLIASGFFTDENSIDPAKEFFLPALIILVLGLFFSRIGAARRKKIEKLQKKSIA